MSDTYAERLEQAYRQRLHPDQPSEAYHGLETQMGKLRRGLARLIDSYADGLIDKQEFERRVTHMRARLQHLEAQMQHLKAEGELEEELRLIVGRLETFAAQVHDGLQQADFHTRREIIRSLVKRVEVDQQHIRVVFRVSPTFVLPSLDSAPHHALRLAGRWHENLSTCIVRCSSHQPSPFHPRWRGEPS